jgi:hypothetical protein
MKFLRLLHNVCQKSGIAPRSVELWKRALP